MLLYHYTCQQHLPSILSEGLSRGDVPISRTESRNAVWLTTSADPKGNGLTDGSSMRITPEMRAAYPSLANTPDEVKTADKTAIQIVVKISTTDRRLVNWDRWSRGRVAPAWLSALHAGIGAAHSTWWLYFGVIPPDRFIEVRGGKEIAPMT